MARRAPLASQERCLIRRQTGPNRGVVTTQPIIEAAATAGFELRVQLLDGHRPRQRHQIVAPGIADQIPLTFRPADDARALVSAPKKG